MAKPRIVIVGGGFGGMFTALNLTQLPWSHPPEIVLLDRHDRFLFSPLLYELVTGEVNTWEIAPYFQELIAGTGILFHQGTVKSIDLGAKTIQLETTVPASDPLRLDFDCLVFAVGSGFPHTQVQGAKDHALTFRTLADAQKLIAQLQTLEATDREKIRICVCGGGASGVEIASKLSDRLGDRGRIRIVDRNAHLLSKAMVHNRQSAEIALQKRGVWIDLGTNVVDIDSDTITLDYQGTIETLPVDMVLWTVGNSPHPLVAGLESQGIPTHQGKIVVDPSLQVPNHNLWSIGDVSCVRGHGQNYIQNMDHLPATAQVAYQQSTYCAKNIWASYHHQPQIPFTYVPLGEFISLGIGQATMSVPVLPFALTGILPNILRRAAYLTRLPTLNHQLKVGLHWLSGAFQS